MPEYFDLDKAHEELCVPLVRVEKTHNGLVGFMTPENFKNITTDGGVELDGQRVELRALPPMPFANASL